MKSLFWGPSRAWRDRLDTAGRADDNLPRKMESLTTPVALIIAAGAILAGSVAVAVALLRQAGAIRTLGQVVDDLRHGVSMLQENIEFLRGSLVVEVFCPKNRGPGRAQVVIQAVIEALLGIGTCGPKPTSGAYGRLNGLSGPSFYSMDNKPFFSARCGAGFIASYN